MHSQPLAVDENPPSLAQVLHHEAALPCTALGRGQAAIEQSALRIELIVIAGLAMGAPAQPYDGVHGAVGEMDTLPGLRGELNEAVGLGPAFGGKWQVGTAARQGEGDTVLTEATVDVVAVTTLQADFSLPATAGQRCSGNCRRPAPGFLPECELASHGGGERKALADDFEILAGRDGIAGLVGRQCKIEPGAGKIGMVSDQFGQQGTGVLWLPRIEPAYGLPVAAVQGVVWCSGWIDKGGFTALFRPCRRCCPRQHQEQYGTRQHLATLQRFQCVTPYSVPAGCLLSNT